jgi:hypothetical protein
LFVQRHRKDRKFFEAGLLVWQFRQQHKVTTTILPPIFYHSHSWAQRRTTWLLPLFVRDNNVGDDEAWTSLLPLGYVQRRKGENLDIVQFPLVWHIERGENQGTFGAFVWWDIRRKGKMAQLVPGVFTRAAGPHVDLKVVGPGLAWWARGKGEREGDRLWRILFGLFGGGVEGGERYAVVFGARVRRGPARAPKAKAERGAAAKRRARVAGARARRLKG